MKGNLQTVNYILSVCNQLGYNSENSATGTPLASEESICLVFAATIFQRIVCGGW